MIFLIAFADVIHPSYAQQHRVPVLVKPALDSLLRDEDTDGDLRITIDDSHLAGTERGNKQFWLAALNNNTYQVSGTYFLSNLLQELKLLEETGKDTAPLPLHNVFEPPAERISRSVRELYWKSLTRTIDERGLPHILADEKMKSADGKHYLYIPAADTMALAYFQSVNRRNPGLNVSIVRLPRKISAEYLAQIKGKHGVLSLALRKNRDGSMMGAPFVVPGGRFNEMYGWDSYFIVLGLLRDGEVELAKSMIDNQVYQIRQYGAILNANRTYYLTRSQPPFLTSGALECYKHLPKNSDSREWLRTVLAAAIKEYRSVWMGSDRLTETGLSRYFDTGEGVPPEVEPGHFESVFKKFAEQHTMSAAEFESAYRSGKFHDPKLDAFFKHDRAMRESGHDTSYRLFGVCADLVTVDLNSLLYKIESDIASMIRSEFGGNLQLPDGTTESSAAWNSRAAERQELMNKFLWDEKRGMFFDYNVRAKKRTEYVSATTLYPLWAKLATRNQAERLMHNARTLLVTPGGIVGSTESSRGPITAEHPLRQWDYPYGWAPHQMLAWQGFLNYTDTATAQQLVYRWLFTIALNASQYNGTVPEKFDVVRRSHQVFAEYGNVGTKFSYITREGFGWTNASFQIGLGLLTETQREQLNRLLPPEVVFK
ncbi:MAG: trehalase [Ignavibacteriae bacterium]|nr:trehalase [Ignavibacteriota bacterium]